MTFGECYERVAKVASDTGFGNSLFLALGHGIGCIGNESWPVITFGKEWGNMEFIPGVVEIAAVVFNKPGLGGLRLESPTLVTNKKADVLPDTPFEVDYI